VSPRTPGVLRQCGVGAHHFGLVPSQLSMERIAGASRIEAHGFKHLST